MNSMPGFATMLDDMHRTMKAKNADYAGDKGAFFNFELVEKLGVASTERGILVRMLDKVSRISTLIDAPDTAKVNESVIDTLKDLANYSIILACYMQEKANKPTDSDGVGTVLYTESNPSYFATLAANAK